MAAEETPPSEREGRLRDLVLDYEKARDAGRAPDLQDVIDLHPDLAEELTAIIGDRNPLAPLVEVLRPSAAGGYPAAPAGYEIVEELGRGAMGVVYKARQPSLDRSVALKMILAGVYATPEERARLEREAKASARLEHPNIVRVYGYGDHKGQPFFSLEYVEGGNLAEHLGGRPQRPRWAADMVAKLARAMQAAHEAGVVHRDLKPANVLLTSDGTPKITDFGLAKLLDGQATVTLSCAGPGPGTPLYMAPEQAAGRASRVGRHSDVHALGVILYEMLTGHPPFQGPTLADTLAQIQTQRPVPPSRQVPTVSPALERICLKCLEKQPSRRHASAQQLAEDLEDYLQGLSPRHTPPAGVWQPMVDWVSQSTYVEHFGDMAWLHLWMAPVVLIAHVGVFFLLRVQAPEALVWLLLSSWYAVLFGLIRKRDARRRRRLVPTERVARSLWVGHLLGYAAVCLGYRLTTSDYVTAVYHSYTTHCALTGLALVVLGGCYWSRYYLFAPVWFLMAFFAALLPEWSPLVVGVYSGGYGLTMALWLRRTWRETRQAESR